MEDSSSPDQRDLPTTRAQKEGLREYFAIHEDAEFNREELAVWFRKLGLAANKRDLNEAASALAEYLVDVKGYVTGEDMLQVEAGDIEEARTNASLRLTDVSIRTVVRYMRNTPLPQETGQYERSPAGSQGDSKATTLTSVGAEQALLKIAQSTTVKLPSLKGSSVTVKDTLTFVKKYAKAKQYAWETTGLHGAVTAVRKNAGLPYERLSAIGVEYIIDDSQNHSELAELTQEVSDQIGTDSMLDKAETVVEAVARLVAYAVNKSFEEMRLDIHKCIEQPGFINSGYYIKSDFEKWTDRLTEVRYSDLVSDEMVWEAMSHLLQKFQPLVHKIKDA